MLIHVWVQETLRQKLIKDLFKWVGTQVNLSDTY